MCVLCFAIEFQMKSDVGIVQTNKVHKQGKGYTKSTVTT